MKVLNILFVLFFFTTSASAALLDRGGGLIYDTDLDITWLADANYAMTSGYDTDGRMTWDEAMTWADTLIYGGYSNWRLPASDTCNGYNCSGSEMGHLFYTELGVIAGSSILTSTDPALNYFSNIQDAEGVAYYSGNEYLPAPSNAWYFHVGFGNQAAASKFAPDIYAWAVADRDVASTVVPEPISSILFVTGGAFLAGRSYLKRRRRKA